MSEEKIRISIIEDNLVHVEWLKLEISEDPRYEIVSVDHLARAGIESIKKFQPHILLLDFQLGDITGLEVIRRIRPYYQGVKILAMTSLRDAAVLDRLIFEEDDIHGIVIKGSPDSTNDFLKVLNDLMTQDSYLDSSLRKYLNNKNRNVNLDSLTPKEFEVFVQSCTGKKAHEIARDLSIEVATVNNMKSIIAKKVKPSDAKSLINKLKQNMHIEETEPHA